MFSIGLSYQKESVVEESLAFGLNNKKEFVSEHPFYLKGVRCEGVLLVCLNNKKESAVQESSFSLHEQ